MIKEDRVRTGDGDDDVVGFGDQHGGHVGIDADCEHVDVIEEACRDMRGPKEDFAEEFRTFRSIDRREEDRLVCLWHKTKNTDVLRKLLELRDQTLWYMARKYAYLDNEDDMYCEFKGVWLKCVKKYDGRSKPRQARDKSGKLLFEADGTTPKMVLKRTPFNTYLYTSMKNRVWNILKRRHSKRLLDENGDPIAVSMRSLDYPYGEDGDLTLKDVIPDEKAVMAHSAAVMSDIMANLGGDDPDIARAVSNFVNNPRFDTLTAACNYRVGTLRITPWDRNVLALGSPKDGREPEAAGAQKAMTYLRQMVLSTGTFGSKFEMVSFVLHPSRVDFVIHVDDPKVVRKVKEAVLRCRERMSEEVA